MKSKKLVCLFLAFTFFLTFLAGLAHYSTNQHGASSFSEPNVTTKLGSTLQSLLKDSKNNESLPIRVIISFNDNSMMKEGITKIEILSSKIQLIREWQFISSAIFSTPIEFIEDIAHFSEVRKIWLDQKFSIGKFLGIQPDYSQVSEIIDPIEKTPLSSRNSENYTQIYNGTNVIVALLDTGVDIFHPDLNDSILAFGGVSMVEGDPFPLDFHGHGTFCAGIITGNGEINEIFKGVAPGVEILNIKVLSYLGIGLWSWIISGIEYSITHGADIIAMCFSMPGYPDDPVSLAIDAAIKRGMIVVTAVGDEGPAYSSVSAPGMTQSAITVGAYNDFTHQIASFSGRGPTLALHTKPDILASGVNITSCRPSTPSDLPINLTEFFQGNLSYGIPLDDYYTTVNSTDAAAANITGLIASLLQHSKFLSAEELKIIFQTTAATPSNVGPNVQGAGLVNITRAHSYLIQNNLNNSLSESRLYTPTFFSPGYITNQNSTRNATMIVTSYCSLLALIEADQNYIFTHMIQGLFAVKYNDQIKWLSDMYLLREIHNLTSSYSMIQSIITDYSLIYIFTVETWSSTSGFRVNLTLVNLDSTSFQNLTLFSTWNPDLFWNSSAQFSFDTGAYNASDDIIYVFDSSNGNSSYVGFTGKKPSSAYEINTSGNIRSQTQGGYLLNNSNFTGNDTSIAMEWSLASQLNASQYIQFSQYIGLGNSYDSLNASVQAIKNQGSSGNITNLALLSSNLSRTGSVGQKYSSNVLVMNLGNMDVNNTFVTFLVNSTEAQTQTIFSKYINLGRLEPYEFRRVNITWNPTDADIYSSYWIVGTESLINEIILYFMNVTQEISLEQDFLDNFFVRNIFIKNTLHEMHNIFPKNIPIAPQLVYYPSDAAIFNISITTNHPLNNLQVVPLDGNLSLNWISYNFPSNIHHHGSIQITISIPFNPKAGAFYRRLNITADNTLIGEIWVNFSIRYPSGRILFYKPTFNLSIQDTLEIDNLLSIWNERLDTIYGAYFQFFNLCLQYNYDVDDFGLLTQFTSNFSLDSVISLPFDLPFQTSTIQQNFTYISNYDMVIICDPEINLTQGEIDTLIEFGQNGGSLFFWIEPDTECEHRSINSILNPFGIQINNSYNLITNQTFLKPDEHELSFNLTEIKLYNFVSFQNLSSLTIFTQYNTEPTLLLNDSFGKILCIGDSSLFSDSCILEADNYQLLNNSINWLLKEKINISLTVNQNETAPLRIDQHLTISIHLTSINETELSNNLTLYTYLITPSNQTLYMIFFHVQDGWFNSIYLDSWLNETGTYFLVIYANSPFYISGYVTHEVFLEDALPLGDDPGLYRDSATAFQILLGILVALIITGIIMGIFFYQRRQWHRKMAIVELREKMTREISNLLSEYHLYIRELEELLQKGKVLDPDKLRMVVDKQERKKELLKRLKKLGKKV